MYIQKEEVSKILKDCSLTSRRDFTQFFFNVKIKIKEIKNEIFVIENVLFNFNEDKIYFYLCNVKDYNIIDYEKNDYITHIIAEYKEVEIIDLKLKSFATFSVNKLGLLLFAIKEQANVFLFYKDDERINYIFLDDIKKIDIKIKNNILTKS